MKILFAHLYDSSYDLGGAEQGVLEMAVGMKKKFDVDVVAAVNSGPLQAELNKQLIPTVEIHRSKMFTPLTLIKLREVIVRFQPNLIHSHHRYSTFLLDLLFKDKCALLHTERVIHQDKTGLFRFGHYVAAVSDGVRDNLIRRCRVPQDRVRTILNAVCGRPVDKKTIRDRLGQYPRKEGRFFGICVGRFERQKGHEYLIDAVCRMPIEAKEKIKIFLAGDGPLKNQLSRRIQKAGLEENFIFLGYTREIPEFLSLSDVLILPSLWEGLPRAAVEAFQCGKPVIATDIPGTREAVKDRENGLLVPAGNPERLSEAITNFIGDENLRKRITEGAIAAAQKFSFDRMLGEYHHLYQELIQEFSCRG